VDVAEAVRDAAHAAVELVASPAVEAAWTEPSTLDGYRVGGLAAHLVRAIETIRTYVEADPPAGDGRVVDAAGYFTTVLADHDPHDSSFHEQVRARGEARVDTGAEALREASTAALAWLDELAVDADQVLAVRDGVLIGLPDYLDTRLVELVVHTDDLARSVGAPTPALPDEVWERAVRVLAATACHRHGSRAVAVLLARPDRSRGAGSFDVDDGTERSPA
jgi:hypothetical protein